MPLQQLRNVNFGKTKSNATGSTGVGYALLDVSGSVVSPRTTTGVYQLTSGSGLYAAYVSFPDHFRGQLLWDTGAAFASPFYATEQFNVEENNPKVDDNWRMLNAVTGSVQVIRGITEGRWKIINNQMVFYDSDNTTVVAVFNLFDDLGAPTMDSVFERVRVG